jgi:hypothetical protein
MHFDVPTLQAPSRPRERRLTAFPTIFGCILCECGIGLRLDSKGENDGELIVPPDRKCA